MNRLVVAAVMATTVMVVYVLIVATIRLLDWIFQGHPLLWLALPLGWLVVFAVVVFADIATEGKVVGDE